MKRQWISIVAGVAFVILGVGLGITWTMFRVYVPPGQCAVLIRKTGAPLPPGERIASPGQKGVQRETLGPGRYFYSPWAWEWELHPLVEISAGNPASWAEHYSGRLTDTAPPEFRGAWPQVGILVNKVGKPAPTDAEVVPPGYQGIQRDVLTPGVYRINPYVYELRTVPATIVPLGYCGVVTSQLGDLPGYETIAETLVGPDGQTVQSEPTRVQKLASPGQRGVLRDVLPPGIYYLNPYVHRVDIVQVGYNQLSSLKTDAEEVQITFPSEDGFTINVEVTVVWGRHPANTSEMLNRFGDLNKVKEIILSQMRSICRNLGSEYVSTDFIRGEKRELYQQAVTETLRKVCGERDIEILIALIHNIEVQGGTTDGQGDMDLKGTIQRGFIAREQDLTKQALRETARVRAELETARAQVEIARETISAETRKKVAQVRAEGERKAREIDAQRDLEVATIQREIAELDAERTRVLGRAQAGVEQLLNQAQADGKRMFVEAFGSSRAYNLYTFAENFAPESIRLIFAGDGTLWTDLGSFQEAAARRVLQDALPSGN